MYRPEREVSIVHFFVIAEGGSRHLRGERQMTKHPTIILALVLSSITLGGCAATAAPEEAQAAAKPRELNRADAIASARQDATRSYGDGWTAQAGAQLQGGFWVVELQARTGYRLRYAISARDGSIRERNMMQ
jgi:hypothetical protein